MSNEEPTNQPALPSLELPEYHGRTPVGMRTAIAGTATRITRPHTIGDKLVIVVEVKVKAASHADTNDGLIYSEKYQALDLFELAPDQGARLLTAMRSIWRDADDAGKGRAVLPDLGDIGHADASGVVLTPEELAELRGDPVRAVFNPDATPCVIVYEDGSRDLWPDGFPKDAPRPQVGEKFLTGSGDQIVVKLLDYITGEELAVDPAYAEALAAELAAMEVEKAEQALQAANLVDLDAAPADDFDDWETLPVAPLLDLDEFLGRSPAEIGADLATMTDLEALAAILGAEQARGASGSKSSKRTRPAVVKLIDARIGEIVGASPDDLAEVIEGNFPQAAGDE